MVKVPYDFTKKWSWNPLLKEFHVSEQFKACDKSMITFQLGDRSIEVAESKEAGSGERFWTIF